MAQSSPYESIKSEEWTEGTETIDNMIALVV